MHECNARIYPQIPQRYLVFQPRDLSTLGDVQQYGGDIRMKSYRHLRHVLATSRAGHGFCRETDQRGLIAIYERIERKGSRRE